MRKAVSATEARIRFGELLRRVADRGEAVVVERSGRPAVVVLSLVEYERLRAGAGRRAGLEKALEVAARIRARRGDVALPDPAGVVREGREERDGEVDAALR